MDFRDEFLLIRNTPLGDLQVRYYGIIVVTAMLVAAFVAARLARSRKLDPDHIWGGLTWAIFPGIILARAWYVVFPPISLTAGCETGVGVCMDFAWFMENFFNLTNGPLAIWSGGLSIFGAVLGGLIGAWLYLSPYHNAISRVFHYIFLPISIVFSFIGWVFTAAWQRIRSQEVQGFKVPAFEPAFPAEGLYPAPWFDIAAVVLPLAQAIGRWANYVNQELYGLPTTLPWGITIDAGNRVAEYSSLVEFPIDTLFHPLFLYEALWSLGAFFVLYRLFTRSAHRFVPGDLFLIYLMQYSLIRFLLEFLRVEIAEIPGTSLNSSQAFTALIFVLALVLFLYRRRNGVPQQAEENNLAKGSQSAAG